MTAGPLLRFAAVSRRFTSPGGWFSPARSMTAVRSVSFDIAKGDVVGVVGESGCGKSTLARLALRLITPTAGSVAFQGSDLGSLSPRALRALRGKMGMVFQDPYASLDPRYTVTDVLAEPFRVQGDSVTHARIDDLLDQVGLPRAMAESYPHHLSGGQRQRVGIARALATEPDFVVLDEPTASLDVSIQAQIVTLLAELRARRGLTYLFISHDLGLVRYFCDRIVVMYLGAVVEDLPDTAITPRHPYTAALMASSFAPDPALRRAIAPLKGEIPSPFNLPKGCAFAARCPSVSEQCRFEVPPLVAAQDGHALACFHPLGT